MDSQLRVVITGDGSGATRAFQQVTSGADKMGDAVERAGKDGAKGITEVGQAAQKQQRSMQTLGDTAKSAGLVFAGLGTGLAIVGRAALNQDRLISGLERAYGDASAQIIEFSNHIQDTTRFSNDAAQAGALLASSLVQNYNLSTEQIEILMSRSADLAQIYGYTLPDALQRTSSAIRGEGEAAEMLGLNMSDAAIAARALDAGITNWSVPGALSEAEKAAFRFQVFMEDSQYAVGAATDASGTSVARLINQVQDAAQAFGQWTGVAGETVAVLGDNAANIAILGVATASAGKGFVGLARSAATTRAGIAGMALAANPLALALGAVGIAGLEMFRRFQQADDAADAFNDTLEGVADTVTDLRLSGFDEQALQLENFATQLADVSARSNEVLGDTDALRQRAQELGIAEIDLVHAYSRSADEQERVTEATIKINAAMADQRVNSTALAADITTLYNQFRAGTITADEFDAGIIAISENIAKYAIAAEQATGATSALGVALAGVAADAANAAIGIAEARVAMGEFAALDFERAAGLVDLFTEQGKAAAEFAAQLGLLDTPLDQINETMLQTEASRWAANMVRAGEALETGFRVVIENTNAIGDAAQATADWADELIGVEGEWSELDHLLERGRISTEQHTAAQQAQIQIHQANARIQLDVLAIQAQQAPLLAQLTEQQAGYLATIRQMPAEQQLVTLGFMDATEAAKVQNAVMLAGAAAAGELGENGEAAATRIIQGAVAADPILKAMLLDMGLIEQGADGTITINFGDAESATSVMQDLIASVDALTLALGGVPPFMLETNLRDVAADAAAAAASFADLRAASRSQYNAQARAGGGDGTGGAKFTPEQRAVEQPITSKREEVTFRIRAIDEATPTFNTVRKSAQQLDRVVPLVTLEADDQASAKFKTAQARVESFDGSAAGVIITADDEATPTVNQAANNVQSVDGTSATMTALGVDLATTVAQAASGSFHAINGQSSILTAIGQDFASAAAHAAGGSFSAINGQSATLTAIGVDLASGAAASARNAIASVDGMSATSYINIVTRHITQFISQGAPSFADVRRHGGVVGYAGGGIVAAELAEAGPELVHMQGGGVALVPNRGIYGVPQGSYVTPAPATRSTISGLGGMSVTVNVAGNVYGIDDLTNAVIEGVVPALVRSVDDVRSGQGVRR